MPTDADSWAKLFLNEIGSTAAACCALIHQDSIDSSLLEAQASLDCPQSTSLCFQFDSKMLAAACPLVTAAALATEERAAALLLDDEVP